MSRHLETNLSYKPFVFNSIKGTYIFVRKTETFENIEKILISFFSQKDLNRITIHNTSFRPYFFRNLTTDILTSDELSALGWKRFMSSFLLQIDPYDPSNSPESIKVFARFKENLLINGTKLQRRFFKRRMKILRDRVSLDSIEHSLNYE